MSGRCTGRPRRSLSSAALLLFTTAILASCRAGDGYPQTTFRPVSEFGELLNQVFYNTFWWTMIILILVIVLILFAAIRFREQPGAPQPAQIHGNTKLEIAWTIVPALIIVFMGVPTVRAVFDTQRAPPADALVVEVIGHQWWWEFRYPEYDIVTANQLWVPVGRPVSLEMHSADVIHSFWIPRIGGKRDVNPLPRRPEGVAPKHSNYLLFTVEEPGHYPGQCAEYCGEAHAIMAMSIMAVEPAAFEQWVRQVKGEQPGAAAAAGGASAAVADTADAGQPEPGLPAALTAVPAAQQRATIGQMPVPTGAGNPFVAPLPDSVLYADGQRIFLSAACVACHTVANTTAGGLLGPNLTLFGSRPLIGAGAMENTQENLVEWIRNPQRIKPGTMMPGTTTAGGGMPPTGLTDQEVRAVAAYLSSLK
ncbi:MAG: cytochrome c oxidase subunit II [Gemmatimonadota bacterium]